MTVEGLTKRYGKRTAIEGLTFGVRSGVVTGFLGPNGAGKSTTLKALVGLITPSAGRVDVSARSTGVYIDACGAHPGRTARDHLRSLAALAGHHRRDADRVLERVGLAEDAHRRVKGFSMGMRQRLGLAGALLGDPEVLILDEPLNGLDPHGIRWVRGVLREHAAQGGTVLLSSHVLSEVAQTVDDVLVIDRGRLVKAAPIGELIAPSESLEDVYLALTTGERV